MVVARAPGLVAGLPEVWYEHDVMSMHSIAYNIIYTYHPKAVIKLILCAIRVHVTGTYHGATWGG